ncbi:cytochrome c oxidase family protein [Cystobasidium minutum MCA 4210]|uniref:cytochrome c oxidase family protein n=1 Tax=Cystobasidium minutum MCA 4210 TaxID=1397322 RepID=UPI0034CF83BE|eukprot:jgi/Rhomi1/31959/CE31958_25852
MAIPQYTGKFRRRLLLDLSCSLGLGTAAGMAWWYGWHVRKIQLRDNWYIEAERKKAEQS